MTDSRPPSGSPRTPRRPHPTTFALVLLLLIGGLVLASVLTLNFLTHELNIPFLVIGIALIAVAVTVLVVKELK